MEQGLNGGLIRLKIGKIPNDILQKIILDKIGSSREEVLIRPKIGEDCCAVDFGEHVCVLSSDPVTGAVNEVGRIAVHVSCNDIASCGVEPIGLVATILAPPGTTEGELDSVMKQLCETAGSINVDIIGGHTEITSAVCRFVIVTTAIGRALKGRVVTTSGARAGNDVVMTKTAGVEGTAIIAFDKEAELLKALGRDLVDRAKEFMGRISVVKEGIVAGEFGVDSMHDVTEGGILGAAWEISEASGCGLCLYKDRIPVAYETQKICGFYGINPLKLISSGCMLITCGNGALLVEKLKEAGIGAAVIGKITADKDRRVLIVDGGLPEEIRQPESDELYKVVG